MRRVIAALISLLVALAWLTSAPTAANASVKGSMTRLAVSPPHPIRGSNFTVFGRVSTKVVRKVELQSKTAGKWRTIATGNTERTGRFSFSTSTSAASLQLRTYAKRTRIKHKTYRSVISRVFTLTTSEAPVSQKVAAIAAGGDHTCAVLVVGTVKCWGNTTFGQAGVSLSNNHLTPPVQVPGISKAIAITAGSDHSCALIADGTIKCWGMGDNGQLGNGATESTATPVTVLGISDAVAVSAGYWDTCALLRDATVKCWGYNTWGQLGDGTTVDSSTPVAVKGLTGAVKIAAGEHSCAILNDATIKCWGLNWDGALGDGTETDRHTPVSVESISNAVDVIVGEYYTCSVLADGGVKCWGAVDLKPGTYTSVVSDSPVAIPGISNAQSISGNAGSHICSLLKDGTLKCWVARGADYETGPYPDNVTWGANPTAVQGVSNAASVIAGAGYTCVLRTDQTVHCWGDNSDMNLGSSLSIPVGTVVAVIL